MELSEKDLQTRTRILDVASDMFNQHGFNRITMSEIAEKLGMSKKTLYRFFSGKEELTIAVVMYYRSKFDDSIMPIVQEETEDFMGKLMRIGSVVSTLMGNVPVCFVNDLEKYMPNVLREHAEWKRKKISESLGSILREGIQSGSFRSHLSVELITLMYLTVVENLFRPDVFAQISMTPSQMYIAVMRVFFEGIMTDAGREQFRYKILSDAEKLFKSEVLLPW